MAFLGGLFNRKPGGTFFGNLIRGVAKTAVGVVPGVGGALSNVIGNGAMMISQEDADKRDLSEADYQAKYGKKKDGTAIPVLNQYGQGLLNSGLAGALAGTSAFTSTVQSPVDAAHAGDNFIEKYWKYIIWIFPLAAGVIAYRVYKNRKNKKKHL